jgi:hypothetical protein
VVTRTAGCAPPSSSPARRHVWALQASAWNTLTPPDGDATKKLVGVGVTLQDLPPSVELAKDVPPPSFDDCP